MREEGEEKSLVAWLDESEHFLSGQVAQESALLALRASCARMRQMRTCHQVSWSLAELFERCREIKAVELFVRGEVSFEQAVSALNEHSVLREARRRGLAELGEPETEEFVWSGIVSPELRGALLRNCSSLMRKVCSCEFAARVLVDGENRRRLRNVSNILLMDRLSDRDEDLEILVLEFCEDYVLGMIQPTNFDAVCLLLNKLESARLRKLAAQVSRWILEDDLSTDTISAIGQKFWTIERSFAAFLTGIFDESDDKAWQKLCKQLLRLPQDEFEARVKMLATVQDVVSAAGHLSDTVLRLIVRKHLVHVCLVGSAQQLHPMLSRWTRVQKRVDLEFWSRLGLKHGVIDDHVTRFVRQGADWLWIERLQEARHHILLGFKVRKAFPQEWASIALRFAESGENIQELLQVKAVCEQAVEAARLGLDEIMFARFRCRAACVTILAIRKFRADWKMLDKHVIVMIAKLVYETRRDLAAWSFDLPQFNMLVEFPKAKAAILESWRFEAERFGVACLHCTTSNRQFCPRWGKTCLGCNRTSASSLPYHLCRHCALQTAKPTTLTVLTSKAVGWASAIVGYFTGEECMII